MVGGTKVRSWRPARTKKAKARCGPRSIDLDSIGLCFRLVSIFLITGLRSRNVSRILASPEYSLVLEEEAVEWLTRLRNRRFSSNVPLPNLNTIDAQLDALLTYDSCRPYDVFERRQIEFCGAEWRHFTRKEYRILSLAEQIHL